MAYKVHVNGFVIEVDSLEGVDELMSRYGGATAASHQAEDRKPHTAHTPEHHLNHHAHSPQDKVLLRRLVAAGNAGIEASAVGDLLGKKGKGIRPALRAWCSRVKLSTDGGGDAFEPKRVGTKRGFRIRTNFLEVARTLDGGK
jgi:hypothetical protein